MLERSLFYNQKEKSFYDNLSFENESAILRGNPNKYTVYKFIEETQEYEFIMKPTEAVTYRSKFTLESKSDVGVKPQHKIGTYYIDRTKEYQEKYLDKNISKVTEEQKVECIYNE